MNNKEIKKLSFKHSYLKIEKEEVMEICKTSEKEIQLYIKKNYPDQYHTIIDLKNKTLENERKTENTSEKKKTNKDVKMLYRKIASKIHPDKNTNTNELFTRAAEAYSNNDIGDLLEIAAASDIKVDNLSEDTVNDLKENIKNNQELIEEAKKTTGWAWQYALSNEEKDSIVNHIFIVKEINK
mgnify:FL=1|tara:strand:+ start:343 stop:891 length:549 start_codon:yes stop_codon:yes gene_type:complete